MASTRSTTPADRFTALEISSHNIQLKLEEYHEEVSRLSNDMAALTKAVAQLIHDNNEVFDEALAKLCQTGTVREYQAQFEQLPARVHNWTEQVLVESYIGGLKEEIRSEIKLFQPTSLLHATSLARLLEYKLQRFRQPPQPSVEIEVQVPKDVASTFVQEEVNVEPKQQADEKKVLLENENKEDTKLDEANKIDTITFSVAENKYVSFATLISHIDFVIPEIFNNVVEHQNFLFVMLPKVIPDLKQASNVKIVILRHFKTRGRVFSNNHVDDATWAKYLDLQRQFSHLNLEDKIHIQGGWNVMTRIK
uniref:Retrotransposon gag domain-containing protein n=1 Tax=Fagus sylvatica TaxID=28930 RepID=A0A2N9E792_FAGSY